MNEENKEPALPNKKFVKEAEKIAGMLDQEIGCGQLADIGSRGLLLANAVGDFQGFNAARKKTGTLLERAIWMVNMFDQADTSGTIMNKPRGREYRNAIEKLRTALNQNGKLTILDSQQIKETLEDRDRLTGMTPRNRSDRKKELQRMMERVTERNKDAETQITL
jgi:hypothetical protein